MFKKSEINSYGRNVDRHTSKKTKMIKCLLEMWDAKSYEKWHRLMKERAINLRNVWEMKRWRRRINVIVVLWVSILKTLQWRIGVVLRQLRVLLRKQSDDDQQRERSGQMQYWRTIRAENMPANMPAYRLFRFRHLDVLMLRLWHFEVLAIPFDAIKAALSWRWKTNRKFDHMIAAWQNLAKKIFTEII